ncbi:type IV secretion system protein [Sulfurirhabdus autotrophica]|uniref:Type IV secretion system protein VirB6 n=1 Tax=Sulfurirhabdus autotrophica TaxID=1706046 RepID=A0A4R3XSV2_9PROT|nr:type IV secretion system protein [Sulfurirhabdus autotrophica]TCV82735.1 type IV secretion system protein VirB6 [Sulfurirhabdus autotrophica]
MSLPTIVAPLFVDVDTAITGFMLSAASRVSAASIVPFKTLVTVYIFLWGLAMWRGLIDEPMSDAVSRIFRIVLIGVIALGTGVYGPVIANFLYNTPAQLASTLIGATTSPQAVMDVALNKGNDIANAFMSITSLSISQAFADSLAALVTWIFTGIIVLYGAALILLSKIALGIIIALGPLFIAMLLFDSTKSFFQSWISQALNYLFIYALVAAVVMIMFALWLPSLDIAIKNSGAGFSAIIPMMIVGGACFVILMQVTGIASGLAGGVQVGTLGAIGWTGNKLGRGAGAARRGTLRREEFRRADGSRGTEWRGAVPAASRTATKAYKAVKNRFSSGNSVSTK